MSVCVLILFTFLQVLQVTVIGLITGIILYYTINQNEQIITLLHPEHILLKNMIGFFLSD